MTGFFWHADVMIWIQLAVAVVSSVGFYKLIEKPLLKHIQHKNKQVTYKKQKIIHIPENAQ
jgi:peptidoglycan/LPS O-acetylase OafA/YrhL